MGTSPLMSLGLKAMAANYAALQTTGHNIANANVAGYSRQTVELSTSQGLFTGAGFFGRGVDIAAVTRAHDALLTGEAISARSLSAMDSTRLAELRRLEQAFPTGEGSIGDAVSQLFSAVSDLSSRPDDLAARQVLLGRARDLAGNLRSTAAALQGVQTGLSTGLRASVATVNGLSQDIALANQRIAAMQGMGQDPNDLLDQREALISELAQQVQLSRIDAPDGTVSLFVGGGQNLVLGTQATPMQVVVDSITGLSTIEIVPGGQLGIGGEVVGGLPRPLDDEGFGGGVLQGLLDVQNKDLAEARAFLDEFAVALRDAFNNQQAAGFDLDATAGAPLFGAGSTAATMTVSLTDPRGVAAAQVAPTPGQPGDNLNLLAMLALQDGALVQGQTINEAWVHFATDVGVRVQSATTGAQISGAVAEQSEQARSSQAGVNLDEEAARLIHHQQSYQAAAKVLQVAQTLFDTLLQVAAK